jgi:hypothetical protein
MAMRRLDRHSIRLKCFNGPRIAAHTAPEEFYGQVRGKAEVSHFFINENIPRLVMATLTMTTGAGLRK